MFDFFFSTQFIIQTVNGQKRRQAYYIWNKPENLSLSDGLNLLLLFDSIIYSERFYINLPSTLA